MAVNTFKIVNLGIPGLATVTARLYDPDGTANGAAVAGVERGVSTGIYGATVSVPDAFLGELRWDSGGATPVYASEDLNPLVLDATTFPAGANEVTFTVRNSVTLLPIDGATVWISTDLAGVNVIWSGTTDSFGVARNVLGEKPFLNTGTYYGWVQDSGYTDTNPTTLAVSP